MAKQESVKSRARQDNIFAPTLNFDEYEFPRTEPKTPAEKAFLSDAMFRSNFVFESLNDEGKEGLIESMTKQSYAAGSKILLQGIKPPHPEDDGSFYLVASGTVLFYVDDVPVGSCSSGGSFGELALLYDSERAATCLAEDSVDVFRLDRMTFLAVLHRYREANSLRSYKTLRDCELFKAMPDQKVREMSESVTVSNYDAGHEVVKAGTQGSNVYIIQKGTVKVHDFLTPSPDFKPHTLTPPSYFGDRSASSKTSMRGATVTALTDLELVIVPNSYHDSSDVRAVFGSLKVVEGWSTKLINELYDSGEEKSYGAGEALEPGAFYVITVGSAVGSTEGSVSTGGTVGWNGGTAGQEGCTVKAVSKPNYDSLASKHASTAPAPAAPTLDNTIRFSDLQKKKILGIGTFGTVWIVHHKLTARTYALKVLSKSAVIAHHQTKGVMREKGIMKEITHPFIVSLVATFQDDGNLYMLIGLLQGGELFSVLHTKNYDGVPPDHASFYAHCILIGLNHLHERRICYRDLKPENVMIDRAGYCVIVDLGFAKKVEGKTYTLCGTPEYLAPEIILSKGHDAGVDIWAFGVLLFEMIYGYSPFYSEGVDQVTLFKRIVQVKYAFPEGRGTDESTDLITRLLVKRPLHRLGCSAQSPESDIFGHPFFTHTNEILTNRLVNAPWVPRIKDELDTGNFDSYAREEKEEKKGKKGGKLSGQQQAFFADF